MTLAAPESRGTLGGVGLQETRQWGVLTPTPTPTARLLRVSAKTPPPDLSLKSTETNGKTVVGQEMHH